MNNIRFRSLRFLLTPILVALLLGLTLTSTGCLSEPDIDIISPTDSISSTDVEVLVDISNFDLVDKIGQKSKGGEGHIIYYLDVTPPTIYDETAVSEPGTYVASASASYTWKNVSPGEHTFSVQLVHSDHTPLDPPSVARITVNVASQ